MVIKLSDEEKNLIGNRIREIREDNGLTVREMGSILKCSGANVSRYENGDVENIPLPRIKILSQRFGINPTWVLGMSDKKNLNGAER